MAADEGSNQVSNIDLAEEVIEESPLQENIPPIDDERKEEMMQEISKLENEILTIKQALQRKETQLAKLRQDLGITRWSRIQNSQAVNKSKQALSDAGQKTSQALRSFSAATATKWSELKESEKVQSMSEKFWATTGAVKAKLQREPKPVQAPPPPDAVVAQPAEEQTPI